MGRRQPRYKSPLPERYRWRNWAAYKADAEGKKKPQIAGSELIGFVNNELFPALKDQIDASQSPQHKVIKQVFEDANNYMKSGPQMLAVIEKLEDAINFHDFKTRASLGDVYEQMLNDLRGAGNAGEFYTPRAITAFMADRVNPRLDKRETVMDPACGTGGFLTAAIDHFRNQLTTKSSADDKRAIEELIHGIEKKQLPHLLCTTNMLLHGIDVPSQIEHRNTLGIGWNEWNANDKVDCIITNPPFGGYEDDGVGSDYPADLRTRETADMFMALIIKKLLKENGRAAVVLPDGFLFGDGIKGTLKKLLLRDCKLHTIIRLPKGVFAPYTTIKTNLLFFTKGATVDDGTEHFHTDTIWFYEHPYPAGYKSYSKTKPIRWKSSNPSRTGGARGQRLCRPRGKRIRLEGRFQNQARTGRSRRATALATRRRPEQPGRRAGRRSGRLAQESGRQSPMPITAKRSTPRLPSCAPRPNRCACKPAMHRRRATASTGLSSTST
jgi:type I restriction enzyme M protein